MARNAAKQAENPQKGCLGTIAAHPALAVVAQSKNVELPANMTLLSAVLSMHASMPCAQPTDGMPALWEQIRIFSRRDAFTAPPSRSHNMTFSFLYPANHSLHPVFYAKMPHPFITKEVFFCAYAFYQTRTPHSRAMRWTVNFPVANAMGSPPGGCNHCPAI